MALVHVYVAPGFEEVEMISIVDVLRRAEIDTVMVSLSEDLRVTGSHGITVQTDCSFSAAGTAATTPDLIALPGGPGANAMLLHEALQQRLRDQISAGKRVAAICAAPKVLAKAGLLKGRKATGFPGTENALLEGGAELSTYNVVTDGLITTSRAAGTAGLFALALVRLLDKDDKAYEVGRAMLYW